MSEQQQDFMTDFVVDPGNVKDAMKRLGASSRDLRVVPFEALKPLPGFNKRDMTPDYEAHIEEITASMVTSGFLDDHPIPVIVQREGDSEAVYYTGGHTRMIAAARAIARGREIKNVPVIVKPRGTTKLDLWKSQVKDNLSTRHTLRELGEIYYEMGRLGLSIKEIAQEFSRSEQHVRDALDTRAFPEDIKAAIIAGKVSPTAALELVRSQGSQKAAETLQESMRKAEQAGRTRVTTKSFSGPRIPPRISANVVSAVETFIAGLDEPTREALAAHDPESEASQNSLIGEGGKGEDPLVSVPASLLRDLMRAHEDIERVRVKAAKRAEKAAAKAAAQGQGDVAPNQLGLEDSQSGEAPADDTDGQEDQ